MVMAFYTGKTKNNFLSNQAMKYIQIKKKSIKCTFQPKNDSYH